MTKAIILFLFVFDSLFLILWPWKWLCNAKVTETKFLKRLLEIFKCRLYNKLIVMYENHYLKAKTNLLI